MSDLDKLEGILGQTSAVATPVAAQAGDAVSLLTHAIPVVLVNHSTAWALSGAVVSALQTQVTRDFFPAWGMLATVRQRTPKATDWVLGVFDTADQAGALGYHETTPTGLPLGKVFVTVSKQAGVSVSSVLSHELLEMLLDPYINLLVQDATRGNRFWAYESCDAVEDTSYAINGVEVSNFVTKNYFQTALNLSKPFDFLGVLPSSVPALTPGGYMAYLENGSWGQVFGHLRGMRRSGWQGTSERFQRRQHRPKPSTFQVVS